MNRSCKSVALESLAASMNVTVRESLGPASACDGMRIGYLHYLHNYLYGASGASVHVQEFVNACRAFGHEMVVLRHGRPETDGVAVPSRGKRYPPWLASWLHEPREILENVAFFAERHWIRCAKPDGVIVRYAFGRASGGLAAHQGRVPWILQVDAPYELESRHLSSYRRLPGVDTQIERWLVKAADAVVLVSREAYDYYRRNGVAPGKLLVVPNGVDPDRFHPDLDGQCVRRRWGLEGRCVVGFVGGFYPWHGIDGLVYFMEEALRRSGELALLLIGDGPEHPRLARVASQLGRCVVLTGPVSHRELPHYLAAIDVAIAPYPSLEPFYFSPMKLFEYMACGLPIVAAAIGQIRDLIRDGDNGLLFAPGDWRGLVRGVERFRTDIHLRQWCGRQARQTVLQGYTWQHVAERVSALVHRVVARVPNPAQGL